MYLSPPILLYDGVGHGREDWSFTGQAFQHTRRLENLYADLRSLRSEIAWCGLAERYQLLISNRKAKQVELLPVEKEKMAMHKNLKKKKKFKIADIKEDDPLGKL